MIKLFFFFFLAKNNHSNSIGNGVLYNSYPKGSVYPGLCNLDLALGKIPKPQPPGIRVMVAL